VQTSALPIFKRNTMSTGNKPTLRELLSRREEIERQISEFQSRKQEALERVTIVMAKFSISVADIEKYMAEKGLPNFEGVDELPEPAPPAHGRKPKVTATSEAPKRRGRPPSTNKAAAAKKASAAKKAPAKSASKTTKDTAKSATKPAQKSSGKSNKAAATKGKAKSSLPAPELEYEVPKGSAEGVAYGSETDLPPPPAPAADDE